MTTPDRNISKAIQSGKKRSKVNASVDSNALENAYEIFASKLSEDEGKKLIRQTFKGFNEGLFDQTNAEHHNILCECLDSFEDTTNVLPRGSAKTTLSSTRYPGYRLGNDRGMRIIIASHTVTMSQSFLRSIESILRMPEYINIFGNMVPGNNADEVWNNTEKVVTERPAWNSLGFRIDTKDPSLFAVGTGGAVVGKRADILILDDIIDRRTVKTEAQIKDVENWLDTEILPIRHFKTQTVISGTRWGSKDIYIRTISDMLREGAIMHSNMIEEVQEQVRRYREIEDTIVATI